MQSETEFVVEPLEARLLLSTNPLTLTGRVFVDENGNGAYNAAHDSVLTSWIVWEDANRNNKREASELFDRTNSGGRYEIQFPSPGTYRVRRGFTPEYDSANQGVWITLNGIDPVVHDFVLRARAEDVTSVKGTVFDDTDGDGFQDYDEPGMDRIVWADLNRNRRRNPGEPFDRTDAHGQFEIRGLEYGQFDIRVAGVSGSPGYEPTTYAIPGQGQKASVTLSLNNPETVLEFGRRQKGQGGNGLVSGTVFFDVDQDGDQRSADPGLANRVVWVDLDGDRKRDADEPFDRTRQDGSFRIGGVPFGTVADVRAVGPGDWVKTTPNAIETTFGPEQVRWLEFGQFSPSEPIESGHITGRVWNDRDANSRIDAGEPVLANEVVYVDLNNNLQHDPNEPSATTNTLGRYRINDVPIGYRTVRLDPQPGYVMTTIPRDGTVTPTGSSRHAIGTNRQAVASGIVFHDLNGNGTRDVGEPGLPGIRIWHELDLLYDRPPEIANFEGNGSEPSTVTLPNGQFVLTSILGGSASNPQVNKLFVEPTNPDSDLIVTGSEYVELRSVSGEAISGIEIGLAGAPVITRDIWTLQSRAFSSYLASRRGFFTNGGGTSGVRYSWGLQGLSTRLDEEWAVTTTSAGTTLKNVSTQQYLKSDGLYEVSVEGGISPAAYWTIVNNVDGSISLQNNANGRFLDADTNSRIGLSAELRNDDGWFVNEIEL